MLDLFGKSYEAVWVSMYFRLFGTGSSGVDLIVQQEMSALITAFNKLGDNGKNSFDPRVCLLTSVVNGLTAAVSI